MDRFTLSLRLIWWAIVGLTLSSQCLAGVPTAQEVLKVCRDNREKLDPLHVQYTHTEERTDAWVQMEKQSSLNTEMILKSLDDKQVAADMEKQVPGITSPAYRRQLQLSLKASQSLEKSVRFENRYEAFIRGENYQLRSEVFPHTEGFAFPNVALTPKSLVKEYARVRIYSRLKGQKPVAKIWPGQPTPTSTAYPMISSKHITDSMRFAPFMAVMQPDKFEKHPIDHFLSAKDEAYRVVGTEDRDGRALVIVEAAVPTDGAIQIDGEDGKPRRAPEAYVYRAWLDLAQGGLPVEMRFWNGVADRSNDKSFNYPPTRVMKATEIKKLANGGYFPVTTVDEEFNTDPKSPPLSEAEWKEVGAGKRKAPPLALHIRHTWKCSAVDANVAQDDQFFVLNFPKGQRLFDLDTGKVVGALEPSPVVKAGQPAPEWKVAKWLDGKEHSLKEFHGKIVVLNFASSTGSGCEQMAPAAATIQDRFKGKPVVFVTIYLAEDDVAEAAKRAKEFALKHKLTALMAIDAGTMPENSQTNHAYGINLGLPAEVIIGPDGIVQYNGMEPEPGMEGIFGKACDEATPEDTATMEAYMKRLFVEAGERWPVAEDVKQEEAMAMMNRVSVFHLSRRIDAALKAGEKTERR